MANELVIGIDLGTTNSCAAYYKDNKIVVLENAQGNRITPSVVFYKTLEDREIIVGQPKLLDKKPEAGVCGIKRLIGKHYTNSEIEKFIKYSRNGVFNNKGNIELSMLWSVSKNSKKEAIKQTPEQITSHVLKKLKMDIEDKFGHEVSNVVITIPAYFNEKQREATLKAGELAGFNVLKLFHEPTAAAMSYFHEVKNCPNNRYYLVYDLGGGTFDVSILKKDEDEITVKAIDGDANLGGYDFDCIVLDYVFDILQKDHNYSPKDYKRALRRVQTLCEQAKKDLSTENDTQIILNRPRRRTDKTDDDDDEDDITIDISRKKFEELCLPLFEKTIDILAHCLEASKLSKTDIEEVILCGGSARIPKIQNMLSDFFNGKKLQKINNLDECVAEGAALQAAILSKSPIQKTVSMRITDVVPMSIGVADFVNRTEFVIKRNTPLPASGECSRYTFEANQSSICLRIFEGERLDASKNNFLGSISLDNLTPAPPQECEVKLKLTLDGNGILNCTATETVGKNTKSIKIDHNKQRNSTINSDNATIDVREDKEADKLFLKFANCKSYLRQYCVQFNYNVTTKKLKSYGDIHKFCAGAQKDIQTMTVKDYNRLKIIKVHLHDKCEPVVKKHNFIGMPENI